MQINAAISVLLGWANHAARVRTLDLQDIEKVLREAVQNGYGYASGGSVASAYARYGTAYSTKAFAVRLGPDWVALQISRVPSNASDATWAGPHSIRRRDMHR